MFKKLLVLLSMLAALAMSAVAFAAPAKSHQQMVIDAARAEVPAAAVFYGYKEEDGEAVLNFRDNDNYLEYEVEVVLATTKVKEVEIKGSNIAGITMMVKTPEDIRQIVLEAYPDARNINQVTQALEPLSAFGIVGGQDYEKVESARLLKESEYTLNSTLGYISLKTALATDEVLAVAYEYTYKGKVYQVGEFSSDVSNTEQSLYLRFKR